MLMKRAKSIITKSRVYGALQPQKTTGITYYKMPITFFVPIPSPDQSTRPDWLKFCMVPYLVILRGLVEGFFRFRSGGLEMGYP